METTTVKFYSLNYNDVKTYWAALLFIVGNILFPQLFHLMPQGGIIWLPIYFFTLIGAYKYGWKVGLLTAILSPIINSLFFDMPAPAVLPAILLRSILLAITAGWAAQRFGRISIPVLIGVVLGFLIAIVRTTHDKTGKLKILNAIRKVYLTVIRGTPVVVQLMIIYFIIFGRVDISKFVVAIVAFGINSGAYVAEIFRSGIMSIDNGQFEAGRSLGFNYAQTMMYIVMPQAFKNVLPTLCNEFISLLKETSVSGYIALQDLTKGGDIIRSRTYDAFMPLIAVALIYLAMVMIFTKLVSLLERRLRNSDH